jgi:alkanesulfonate monooxygenase
MWSDDDGAFDGKHYQLGRTMNVPQSLRRPHPPILIGGGGEKKTLRLVAQYADACNLFAGPDIEHKLDVLRQHCADLGRDYDEIEKTVMMPFDLGADGEKSDEVLTELQRLAGLGVQHVHTRAAGDDPVKFVQTIGEKIVPEAAKF